MLKKELSALRAVCFLPKNVLQLNKKVKIKKHLTLLFDVLDLMFAKILSLRNILLFILAIQTRSFNHSFDSLKLFSFALVLGAYLFISPHTAVKADLQEKVIPDQSYKVEKISAELSAAKIPEFKTPVHGYISTRFSRFHPGIDVPNPVGAPTRSIESGEVIFAGWTSTGHGKLVVIKHELGFESSYAHLSGINVIVGQKVKQGDIIGAVGSTGNSTGSHLHFEIRQDGVALNPLRYVSP